MSASTGISSIDLFFLRDLYFFCSFFNIVSTSFKICLTFNIFLKPLQNIILSELVPIHVDISMIGIVFFEGPPRSIGFEYIFDQSAIVSFSYIEHVWRSGFVDCNFDVIGKIDQVEKFQVQFIFLQYFGLNLRKFWFFLIDSLTKVIVSAFHHAIYRLLWYLFGKSHGGWVVFLILFQIRSLVCFGFDGWKATDSFVVRFCFGVDILVKERWTDLVVSLGYRGLLPYINYWSRVEFISDSIWYLNYIDFIVINRFYYPLWTHQIRSQYHICSEVFLHLMSWGR